MASDDLLDDFDDHPSLSASLEDFEHNGEHSENLRSPILEIPSHHSGFYQSETCESDVPGSESGSPFSPPGGRTSVFRGSGTGWFRHEPYRQEHVGGGYSGGLHPTSREASPQHENAHDGDLTIAANVRLPTDSPLKRSPSPSPQPHDTNEAELGREAGEHEDTGGLPSGKESSNNYIRFAIKAEMQHRTEAFEAVYAYFGGTYRYMTRSRTSTIISALIVGLSYVALRLLFTPPTLPPSPDLIKVAGLAGSYEPLIFYSENSLTHIEDLQETGTAVWDLGESVRYSSIPSSKIISETLDSLSANLKQLALSLTKFFAVVDGDVDGYSHPLPYSFTLIIIVMAWAQGELSSIPSPSFPSITTAFDNVHSLLCRFGIFESPAGTPTTLGETFNNIFGKTTPQRTSATMQRTFHEFLSVLEHSITRELSFSVNLFGLFDAIDEEFFNVAQTAIRESGGQQREEGELLSSLWSRAMGTRAARLRKFERNKELLLNVRKKTVGNKHLVAAHHSKLLSLKMNLEILRTTLVSEMVRANDSSTMSVAQQVKGLESTYQLLKVARERQKRKWKQNLLTASERFSAAAERLVVGQDGEDGGIYEIDGRS
ncbi:MAG: hypothetical protein M1837_000747 [Sclerophora amabilis]|nr:MAG: hypothetical protein M1837_000747 [Sclerophora amabilis]